MTPQDYAAAKRGWMERAAGFALVVLNFAAPASAMAWLHYQGSPAHTGLAPGAIGPRSLQFQWSAPTGFSVPLVAVDVVYAMRTQGGTPSPDTRVVAFDLTTGANEGEWTRSLSFPSAPTYFEGRLVFTGRDRSDNVPRLFVLNSNVTFAYTVDLTDSSSDMPTVIREPTTNQTIAYISTGSRLTAVQLGPASGSVLWSRTGSFNSTSIPTIAGESVIEVGVHDYYAFHQVTGSMNHFLDGGFSGGGGNTAVYDDARDRLYILARFDNDSPDVLTAYNYVNNNNITIAWQYEGAGLSGSNGVALDHQGYIYAAAGTTLIKLNPSTGLPAGSITMAERVANGVTPLISNLHVWLIGPSSTRIYRKDNLTFVRALPETRGDLNTTFKSPGTVLGQYALIDRGRIVDRPGFAVYASRAPGDLNCDGAITVSDIGPFVNALTDPPTYEAQFPNCDLALADINADGAVTVSDIGPFVELLGR